MKAQITIQEWQLLSAYMDDQLAEREKQALETRLKKDPALLAELESLRQTRALLRAVPQRKAPRSFALSPEQARQAARRKSYLFPALSFSSALSALLLILTLLVRLTPAAGLRMLTADQAPQAEMLAAEPAAVQDTAPPIIIWGESNMAPPIIANGRGGGSDNPPFVGGGGDPGIDAMLSPIEEAASEPMEKAAEESFMLPQSTQAVEMPAPAPMQAESVPQSESYAGDTQPLNPILGIAPDQEQGLITSQSDTAGVSESQPPAERGALAAAALPYILAVFAAGSALAAFLLRRKGII